MTEREQPNSEYQRARLEAAELIGVDLDRCSASDNLKIDLAVVLRRALDGAAEDMFAGNKVDLARLVSATERLIGLLPAGELPTSRREDPREALLAMYEQMRERGDVAERPDPIDVPTSDIVPASERADELTPPPVGEDDYKAPARPGSGPTIEGECEVVDVVDVESVADVVPAYDYGRERGWRDHVGVDGSISASPRRPGAFSGRDWGPV